FCQRSGGRADPGPWRRRPHDHRHADEEHPTCGRDGPRQPRAAGCIRIEIGDWLIGDWEELRDTELRGEGPEYGLRRATEPEGHFPISNPQSLISNLQ